MDAEWCLSCDKHLEHGREDPYCSDSCRDLALADRPAPATALAVPTTYSVSPSYPYHQSRTFAHRRSLVSSSQQPYTTPSASCRDSIYSEDMSSSHHAHRLSREGESASAWVGRGVAGIYDWSRQVYPGPPPYTEPSSPVSTSSSSVPRDEIDPLRPSLLRSSSHKRRPAPPKVFVSANPGKTQPAPPMPSRPILAAQTSMPSLLTHSATASLTSIATPLSLAHASRPPSARSSMHIPSKPASVVGDEDDQGVPSAETTRPSLFSQIAGKVGAQIKTWAAGERSALVNNPPYSTSHQLRRGDQQRSPTALTVKATPVAGVTYPAKYTYAHAHAQMRMKGQPRSPVVMFPVEDDAMADPPLRAGLQYRMRRESDKTYWSAEKAQDVRDDHPAYLARGRRTERAVW